MILNKVKEDNNYLFIAPTHDSEELKEKSNEEQKIEIKFESFDIPLVKFFWPTI